MKPISATPETAAAEVRLEWLLAKLLNETLRRGSTLTMPVLIGGTALRRAYGLTRPSTDLDFGVANEREMKAIVQATEKIARTRWSEARATLREDGEHGWKITDRDGRTVLQIGGLQMDEQDLTLAHWMRDTWTLPIGRLAGMKITTGLKHRSKVRDLYDMGFIAAEYPGDVTERQADSIADAGREAMAPTNRWTQDHSRDLMLYSMELAEIGQEVMQAAMAAIEHIRGAREGRWMNQSQATSELREAALREPDGRWETEPSGTQVHTVWRAAGGQMAWDAIVENQARAQALPTQAGIEIPPSGPPMNGPSHNPRARG